jgi:hypothetical protein
VAKKGLNIAVCDMFTSGTRSTGASIRSGI